jgi:CHASE3 domain sensor protein
MKSLRNGNAPITIGTKLRSAVCVMVGLAMVVGWAGLSSVNTFRAQFDRAVNVTTRNVVLADAVVEANSEMISAQRGIVLAAFAKDAAENATYSQTFRNNLAAIRKALDEINSTTTEAQNRALIADIAGLLSDWQSRYADLVQHCASGDVAGGNEILRNVTSPCTKRLPRMPTTWLGWKRLRLRPISHRSGRGRPAASRSS